ncbi:hypothetical protein [Streptomyces nitrosporeus]|uniref:hypothetical protein n=1 Tax=Streptomyces nitrosporeus TaxID=28894 RepID=UPI00167EDE80|nr:hypothetical protein [Streptomyces nitrosporeus]GGZ19674.1 hypothetical protein GCM10010327_58510 [Streptomyces nitrosporeus]
MKNLNRLVAAVYRLLGKSYAYSSASQIRDVIAERCFDSLAERAQFYAEGAATLVDPLAFQPDLLDLHDELYDTWHYLSALSARAYDLRSDGLAECLVAATESAADILYALAKAAEETVPAPETPASK